MRIDAICINQADDRERSSQVAQMERIYRLARPVVVFLGDTWVGCDTIMDTMIEGCQDQTLHYDPSWKLHIVTHATNTSSKELGAGVFAFFASLGGSDFEQFRSNVLPKTLFSSMELAL